MMETLWQDLRFAARVFRKNRGFTLAAVLTIGLGIGATTGIFSVVYGVLLKPLPYDQPERIVGVWQIGPHGNRMSTSDANFDDWRAQSGSFAAMAQHASSTTTVVGGSEPVRVLAAVVSEDFFQVFGVNPIVGRTFTPDEHRMGEAASVVVSHGYWQRYLGGERDLSSRKLTVHNSVMNVVGVMPAGFNFPTGAEMWAPRGVAPRYPSRTAHNWQVVGRLKEGVALESAHAEMSALGRRMKQQLGDEIWLVDAAVISLLEQLVGRVRQPLLILLGATGLLLLVACANVVNLLLAQSAARDRELAVRVALGAGRGRLARQFLTESVLLSLAGGAVGLLIATWGVSTLLSFEPGNLPRADEIGVSAPVLVFTMGVSFLSAAVLGLIVAVRAAGTDPQEALKEGGRSQSSGASSHRLRSGLVVAQVALTLVLLVGAGLLGRSFMRLMEVDPGFRTEDLVVMWVSQPSAQDDAAQARLVRFHDELIERLRAVPGIREVGGINSAPLTGGGADGTFLIMNRPDEVIAPQEFESLMRDKSRTGSANFRIASDGYFKAMGIPLIRGRLFDERDGPDSPHVAVISESLAQSRWPGEEPLGKLIQYGNMDGDLRLFTIAGIVGDIRERGVDSEARPTFYGYYRQRPRSTANFSLVMQGDASASMIAAARGLVREIDPNVPPRFRTIEELFSSSLADRRFNAILLGAFAGAALVLAVLGIYGVTSYTVAQRTPEVGIRVALGAQPRDVLRLIIGQGALQIAVGVGAGLGVALLVTQVLRSFLFEVTPTDPATLVSIAALLSLVALVACYVPARRAARVNPLTALRHE